VSVYGSVAEEARRAFASLERVEAALARTPDDAGLQITHAARLKYARQMQDRLLEVAQVHHVEVCNYRIVPNARQRYRLQDVTASLSGFQNVFSQVYDALKHGKKTRTGFKLDVTRDSSLEFGYSYSGSLGVVLLAPASKTILENNLDEVIKESLRATEISNQADAREIADKLGVAVVKQVFDWSNANLNADFEVDVRWNRSNGRQVGKSINRSDLNRIVTVISDTSDQKTEEFWHIGHLVGINLKTGTFHFVVPDGEDFRGRLDEEFVRATTRVGDLYRALIRTKVKLTYATSVEERIHTLVTLQDRTAFRVLSGL
jgi:hypothetical protein